MEVNMELLGGCLSVDRNRRLYERLRQTYARLPILSHGWDHVHRCLINSLMIAQTETCDLNIVFPAALLHDIGFIDNPDPAGHHERGAKACAQWLEEWSEAERQAIAECVLHHKGTAEGFLTVPVTVEQKIICDADMLEKVGYTGLFQGVRTFAEFGSTCWPQFRSLESIIKRLQSTENGAFYTQKGRELSAQRGGSAVCAPIYQKAMDEMGCYYAARDQRPDPKRGHHD